MSSAPGQPVSKSILSLLVCASFLALPAFAKTLKLPNDEFPVASINIPDAWEPEEINNGVRAKVRTKRSIWRLSPWVMRRE